MTEAILNLACSIIGTIVVVWTLITIIKTDGYTKYKDLDDVDFP